MSFATLFVKGKGFRTSPLCVLQAVDTSSEDDEELDSILSKSQSHLSGSELKKKCTWRSPERRFTE